MTNSHPAISLSEAMEAVNQRNCHSPVVSIAASMSLFDLQRSAGSLAQPCPPVSNCCSYSDPHVEVGKAARSLK